MEEIFEGKIFPYVGTNEIGINVFNLMSLSIPSYAKITSILITLIEFLNPNIVPDGFSNLL